MRTHVLVLPGGGYHRHAAHEAEPIAAWLRDNGLEASVFRYPLGTQHPAVLDAIRAELRRLRSTTAERIGVIGFSAGAHAAGHAALAPHATEDERLDFAILGYPVVSMLLDTHAGSRENLLGVDAPAPLRAETSLERLVTPEAPPFFIWHFSDDPVVPVEHSYLLAQSLASAGVCHALHVFPSGDGSHGLGLAEQFALPSAWPRLCLDWLAAGGWLDAAPRRSWWRRMLRR